MGLAHGIGIGIPFKKKSSGSWSSYWTSLISATVENAAPTDVVMTFPTAKAELTDTDFTIAGKTITNAVWAGAILTLTVSVAFKYGDTPVVTFNKTGQTSNVTNNVLYTMLLTKTGDGTGVSTIRMESSSDVVVTLGANAKFYSNSAGTLNESSTWTITAGALRTAYLKCTTGTALMTFLNTAGAIRFGGQDGAGWVSGTNAAKLTADFSALSFSQLRIEEGTSDLTGLPTGLTYLYLFGDSIAWTYSGALPTKLTYLFLSGNSIAWTYSGALPTGLTYLFLSGISIAWTYSGALPTGLTYLYLSGNSIAWTYSGALPTELTDLFLNGSSIAWTYSGALPTGLTYLRLSGDSIAWTYSGALPTKLTYLRLSGILIAWTYSGALPTGLTYLYLDGNSIAWTYSGALPTGLTYLRLSGILIAWTGLDVGNNGNIGTFSLVNYRITKMSSADMVTLLTQMTNRTGTLPATVTINDYADYASPPAGVVNAVNALKTAKSITTVNLGA